MPLEDRFDIGPPINIGQIATAYPAMQKGLNRKVLLKVIHPQFTSDAELVQRFGREGEAMARIDHPNVVRVYEHGTEDAVPYLAIEWVDGGTLNKQISAGPVNQDTVKSIARDMLQGLQAVHEQNLLHRDLKPDNILMDSSGHAKLADFSLVGFHQISGLTGHGAMVGSPAYMAPEFLDGKPASVQSDLYGLGVVLLELLTGSNPFAATDPVVSLDKIRHVNAPVLSAKKHIDPLLAKLIDTLLMRDPGLRPANAKTALDILDGKPVVVSRATNKGRIGSKRVAIVILIGAVGSVLTMMLNTQSPQLKPVADSIKIAETGSQGNVATSEHINELADVIMPDTTQLLLSENRRESNHSSVGKISSVSHKLIEPVYLTIIVNPWALVIIDDSSVGFTPLKDLELQPGVHTIQLDHDLYPPVVKNIELRSKDVDTLFVDLRAESARLKIIANPFGYLWVDNDSIGLLPRKEPIWLSPGQHFIGVSGHPTFASWSDTINVSPGDKMTLTVDLTTGTMIAVNDNEN